MGNARGQCSNCVHPHKWFEEWRKPGEFFSAADDGIRKHFCKDKAPPPYLRDAYIAGAFARIWRDDQGPCCVRLVPEADSFPDAYLKTDNECLKLEITMALPDGKEMFREWREQRAKAKRGEIELAATTQQRQANAREAIPRAIQKKVEKHYAQQQSMTLLIDSDDARAISVDEMVKLTRPWKNCFEAIYIRTGMDVVKVWPERCVIRGTEPF